MSKLPATFIKEFHNEEAVRKMVYTELGKTGLKISKLSLGGGKKHFQLEIIIVSIIFVM